MCPLLWGGVLADPWLLFCSWAMGEVSWNLLEREKRAKIGGPKTGLKSAVKRSVESQVPNDPGHIGL